MRFYQRLPPAAFGHMELWTARFAIFEDDVASVTLAVTARYPDDSKGP
jgi:hypothetical protein